MRSQLTSAFSKFADAQSGRKGHYFFGQKLRPQRAAASFPGVRPQKNYLPMLFLATESHQSLIVRTKSADDKLG